MKNVGLLVSGIEYKIRKLKSDLNNLHHKNGELNNEIEELNKTIKQQQLTIKELETKNIAIKLSKIIEKGKENLDAKNTINELVREIDKCIGLLNK